MSSFQIRKDEIYTNYAATASMTIPSFITVPQQQFRGTLAAINGGTGYDLFYNNGTAWIQLTASGAPIIGPANALTTTGGADVNVGLAIPPITGQVLTATSSTTATWQTPSTTAESLGTNTMGTDVNVGLANPPSVGQVLTATSSTAATWQNPGAATLDAVYQVGGNNVSMNTVDGPIKLMDNIATPLGSLLIVNNGDSPEVRYIDVHKSYFSGLGSMTPAALSNTLSIGSNANPGTSTNSIVLGTNTTTNNINTSIVIGSGATITALSAGDNIAIGTSSTAGNAAGPCIAIGPNTDATGANSIAIGNNVQSGGTNAVAIGGDGTPANAAIASGNQSVCIGFNTADNGVVDSVVIGSGSSVVAGSLGGSVMIGTNCSGGALAGPSIAIGDNAAALTDDGIAIGQFAIASSSNAIAIGGDGALANAALASGNQSIAIGFNAEATNNKSIAIGSGSISSQPDSISIGDGTTSGQSAVGIGLNVVASGSNSVGIGNAATAAATSIAIGSVSQATTTDTLAIGQVCVASAFRAMAIGRAATASNSRTTALGDTVTSSGLYAITIGVENTTSGTSSLTISPTLTATTNAAINAALLSTVDNALTLSAGTTNNNIFTKLFATGERWATDVTASAINYARPNRLTWGANETKTTTNNVTNSTFVTQLELLSGFTAMIHVSLIGAITSDATGRRWSYLYHLNVVNNGGVVSTSATKNINAIESAPSLNAADPLVFTPAVNSVQFGITTTGLVVTDVIQWILVIDVVYNKFA